jgi:tetratricopeptide (TPR) repeat protein
MVKARAQKGAGTIMYDHDDFSGALDPLYDSFSIYNSINKTFEAGFSLFLHADALAQLGRYHEAEAALFKAEGLAQKHPRLTPRIDLIKAKKALSERRFAGTIKVCQKILAEDPQAGDQKKELPSTTEARAIMALAFAQSGEKATAKDLIERIDLDIEFEGEMLAKILLARAEIMLANDRNDLAADSAKKAQEHFNKLGKPAFEWQAWLLLSLAQTRLNDVESAKASSAQSEVLFSTLLQKWGQENFNSYSARPDVKFYNALL